MSLARGIDFTTSTTVLRNKCEFGRGLRRDTTTEPDFSEQLILERAIRKQRSLLLEAFLLLCNLIL